MPRDRRRKALRCRADLLPPETDAGQKGISDRDPFAAAGLGKTAEAIGEGPCTSEWFAEVLITR